MWETPVKVIDVDFIASSSAAVLSANIGVEKIGCAGSRFTDAKNICNTFFFRSVTEGKCAVTKSSPMLACAGSQCGGSELKSTDYKWDENKGW